MSWAITKCEVGQLILIQATAGCEVNRFNLSRAIGM